MTEQSYRLTFTDGHRFDLDRALGELMENAQKLLEVKGRLRSLLQVHQAVIEESAQPVVLRRIVEAAVELVGARYGALRVLAPNGSLEQVVDVGSARPVESFVEVPLRTRGQVVGTMYLCEVTSGPFTPDDEQLLASLAATAARVIVDARAASEMQRRQRESTAMAEVASALLSGDRQAALTLIVEHMRTLAEADLVCLVGVRPPESVIVKLASGPLSRGLEGLVLPSEGLIIGRAIASGRSLIRGAATGTPESPLLLESTVVIPMPASDPPGDALLISRGSASPRFSERDLELAAQFAAQAGVALELAAAREERQGMLVLEERGRIARDLHDHVIQRLFAAGLSLQSTAARMPDPRTKARVTDQIQSLDEAIAAIRTAIFDLTSDREQRKSIRQQVIELVRELAGLFPLAPRLAIAGPVDSAVSGALADDLLATLREGLTNIARHARAHEVAISLDVGDDEVLLRITDDGVGIGQTGRRSGIENLERRAARRGGYFRVGNGPAGGTELSWRAPIDTSGEEPDDPGVSAR